MGRVKGAIQTGQEPGRRKLEASTKVEAVAWQSTADLLAPPSLLSLLSFIPQDHLPREWHHTQ